MRRYQLIISVFVLFFTITASVFSQELTREDKIAAVNNLGKLLQENYVFPDVGIKCGEHIKDRLKSGVFDTITTKKVFADILTKELQSISKDKHMRVRADNRQNQLQENENTFYRDFISRMQNREENVGFAKVEFLEGGIGYLDLRFFAPLQLSKKHAESAMNLLSNADAVIVDLRKNRGGSPDLIQYICSYFFDKPTHLNSLYWRKGDSTEEFWTYDVGNKSLNDVPVFVLTSNFTFSGGEEFTNNLKTRKRAVIIGETTGGGANPGEMFRVTENLGVFIPTGRAINPVTNSNWEGTGVEPDIKVASAEAYELALNKAKTAAEEYRNNKKQKAERIAKNLKNALNKAETTITSDRKNAEQMLISAFDEGVSSGVLDEFAINMAGYEYLQKKNIPLAIEIFKYNVSRYPGSSNVYDSLGEAYMMNKQTDLAIANYKKSLELDPDNKNAEKMLSKMVQ